VTSSVVGRQPSGSCASWRVTVSRAVPSHPHRRHQPSSATTRQASTARSGSSRWPTTSRPRSSRRANVVRSGAVKVASGTSRSSRWAASELPSSEDLDPYPTSDAPMPTLASTRPRLHPGSGRATKRPLLAGVGALLGAAALVLSGAVTAQAHVSLAEDTVEAGAYEILTLS